MKSLFFTSNTKHYHKDNGIKVANAIDNTNGIVDQLNSLIKQRKTILFIASSPNDFEKVDGYSSLLFEGLKISGINFDEYLVLDNRTKDRTLEFVQSADVIFLSGGDTYIQNTFFKVINLKELLESFEGVIIGQSAGSLNMAKDVYNSPEECEISEPIYFEGLGLSNINIEPHFVLDETNFDEKELYQRQHELDESYNRPIYALCDGSHILETEDKVIVCGESYLIRDGIISKLCDNNEMLDLKQKSITK